MNGTKVYKPATDKQLNWLKDLVAERDHDNLNVQMAEVMLAHRDSINTVTASAAITELLKLPKVHKPAPVAVAAPAAPAVKKGYDLGIYDSMPGTDDTVFVNGRYFILYVNTHGYTVAKRLYKSYDTKSGYSWRKYSKYAVTNMIDQGKAVRLEKGVIAALGKKFNMCMCCGAMLTDPQSVADGIGPVCGAKFGYAH